MPWMCCIVFLVLTQIQQLFDWADTSPTTKELHGLAWNSPVLLMTPPALPDLWVASPVSCLSCRKRWRMRRSPWPPLTWNGNNPAFVMAHRTLIKRWKCHCMSNPHFDWIGIYFWVYTDESFWINHHFLCNHKKDLEYCSTVLITLKEQDKITNFVLAFWIKLHVH